MSLAPLAAPLAQVVTVQVPDPALPPMPPAPPAPPMPPELMFPVGAGVPDWVGPVVVMCFAIVGATIVLAPLARAWARRIDRGGAAAPPLPADVTARLERIENAVEAMSVEVERISEGQRFLTRVMSEMRALPAAEPARPQR